jgi:hypothetical protein
MLARFVIAARRLGEILVEPDRAERGNRCVRVSVVEDELLPLREKGRQAFRLVGVADPEARVELFQRVVSDLAIRLRPIVVEVEGRVVDRWIW